MKNYKFVFALVLSSFVASASQAANIKDPAASTSPVIVKEAGSAPERTGAPYQFVDSEPTAGRSPAGNPVQPGSMDKTPAQSFASGAVAAAHTSPAKSGLTSTQAAANKISEPATEVLLLVALSALAIAVRRQSPT